MKKNDWFENWLECNEIVDKDSQKKPPSNDLIHLPFNNKSLKALNFEVASKKRTKKFYVEDEYSLEKWLSKNEVFDKDNALKERERWMYPPDNLYAIRVDSSIDLHRLTVKQALQFLHKFMKECFRRNDKVVKIIHGKGNHSLAGPKVKHAVIEWLRTEGKSFVHLYKEAGPKHGGGGATLVWLK